MELGFLLFVVGAVLAIIYFMTLCYVVAAEMFDWRHPSEQAVTSVFIKIGIAYAVVVFMYIMGRVGYTE